MRHIHSTPPSHETASSRQQGALTTVPPFDIVEKDGMVTVYCSLPGVAPKDVKLHVENGEIVLCAETSIPELPGKVHALEFNNISYTTRFALPAIVNTAAIEASLRHGILAIRLPITRSGPQRIPVTKG